MAKTIIIIPGLGGSKIYCDCKGYSKFYDGDASNALFVSQHMEDRSTRHGTRLYPSKFLKFTNMDRHFFSCKRTKTKPLLSHFYVSVYKRLVERLQERNTEVRVFSYDWRLSPLNNCHKLKDYIEAVLREKAQSHAGLYTGDDNYVNIDASENEKIILVGHSLGGLMIRILMEYLKFPHDNLSKIYICGTPLIGSQNMYDYNCKQNIIRILTNNENSVDKKDIPRPLLISSDDVVRFIKTFPQTILYLMPTFEIMELKYLPNVLYSDIYIIKTIHRVLGRFNFPGDMLYTLVFNISQKNKINYKIPEDKIQEYKWIITKEDTTKLVWNFNENQYNLTCTRLMDSTVVPCTYYLPYNCSIICDANYLKHSLIMNSTYVSSNILKSA